MSHIKKNQASMILDPIPAFFHNRFPQLKVAWPSGKAGACKALIPSSNLGATSIIGF